MALETIAIYEERNIMQHVRTVSEPFLERLHELSAHPLVGESRGVGLIGGLEIVEDKASKASFDPSVKAAFKVAQRALANGLIVRPLPSDSIGVCPPLIISEEEIHTLFNRLKDALDEALKELK